MISETIKTTTESARAKHSPVMNGFVERYQAVGDMSPRKRGRACESESWWRNGTTVFDQEAQSAIDVTAGRDMPKFWLLRDTRRKFGGTGTE